MGDFFKETVSAFDRPDVPDEMVVDLITQLANSGEKLSFDSSVYDFASTGGPSSLTTILVPLYLFAYGVNVINLAVPGRPAGAVDVLRQIPQYQLDYQSIILLAESHFYLHLEADEHFAPLDRQLFEYRKEVNKINNPNLAIASLLAKKIAGGASNIGLDVRVSPFGNFGVNWDECRYFARKYNRIAKQFGIKSICFLSNATAPYQQYIGRGEALIALHKIMNTSEDPWLGEHNMYCLNIAQKMTNEQYIPTTESLKEAFSQNLIFQGSNYEFFEEAVAKVAEQPYREITALTSGYIVYSLPEIRRYLVCRQKMDEHVSKYPDPSGIVLLHRQGAYVEGGQPVLLIRNSLPLMEEKYSFFQTENKVFLCPHKREVL